MSCVDKEGMELGNVLFNDALSTFYLQLYVVGHMVQDHSDRKPAAATHMGYSFRLAAGCIPGNKIP